MGQEQDVLLGLVRAAVLLVAGDGCVQSRRDDQRGGCDSHQRRHGRCDGLVEAALLLANATSQETATQDEQNVGEDATQHTGLDNADLALLKRNDTDNQLDCIAKGRVHKATQGLSKLRRKLLSRKGQQRRERDDSNEVEDKDNGRVPVHRAGDDAEGHEHEEDIDVVADQGRVDEVEEVLGQSGDGRLIRTGGAYQRSALSRAILGLRHGRFAEGTSAAVAGDAVEVSLYVFCQVRLAKTRRVPLAGSGSAATETVEVGVAAPGGQKVTVHKCGCWVQRAFVPRRGATEAGSLRMRTTLFRCRCGCS